MIRLIIICISFISLFYTTAAVYSLQDKEKDFYTSIDPIILNLIKNVQHENFKAALNLADKLITKAPTHPVGYFFKSAIYDTIIRDYGDHRHYPLFDTMVNNAINLANKLIGKKKNNGDPPDEWLYFYLGGALGFRGLYHFNRNKFLSAFRDGIGAIKQLDICMKLDPNMYDAYYGLGCFYYWKSAKSRFLWFLPFVSDERAKGIEDLITAVKKGRYTKKEARNALLRVYLNEQMYSQTIKLADIIEKEFPEDVFCLIFKGAALAQSGQHKKAAQNYQILINKYLKSPFQCFERIADMSLRKVKSLKEINDTDEIDNTLIFLLAEKKRRKEANELITKKSLHYIDAIKKIQRSTVK